MTNVATSYFLGELVHANVLMLHLRNNPFVVWFLTSLQQIKKGLKMHYVHSRDNYFAKSYYILLEFRINMDLYSYIHSEFLHE